MRRVILAIIFIGASLLISGAVFAVGGGGGGSLPAPRLARING